MNAAQLARLQQQLAQYGRGNGQQQMMNPAMGGMGNQQSQQQLQQAFMQQQLQQNQGQQGGMQIRRNSSLGMNSNSAAALAMMQQQQQQVAAGGSQMANANMSQYWNALQNQNTGAMDASTASGAQLAALAGMNMSGNNQQQNNAANMLLGNRNSQQQPQQQMQGMGGNQQMQGMGQTNDANLLQQQIAQLQRQLQQQQQQQQNQNQGLGMQGGNNVDRRNSGGSFGMQGNQQQQLFQQMQQQMANGMMGQDPQQAIGMQQNKMGNDFPMNAMMQNQNVMQQNLRNSVSNNQGVMQNQNRGTLNEQDLLLQQQQLLRSSGMSSNSMQNDAQKVQEMFGNQQNSDLMGQRRTPMQQQMGQVGMGGRNSMGFDMDGSMSSQQANLQNKPNQVLDVAGMGNDKGDDANQKSFLDGSFAGGWQSNADLPDRRRIIFSILEVIRQMRPDTNKISQKLPHMAKSLEEHLYRSAQTKEEYLDPSTLKKRLQLIAHGLEIHRSTSSSSVNSHGSQNKNQNNNQGVMGGDNNQQLQQLLAMQQGNNMNQNQNQNQMGMNNSLGMVGSSGVQNSMGMDMMGSFSGMDTSMNSMSQSQNAAMMQGDGSNNQDRVAAQKKKVIRQQQQRLLLLRHASKCKEGPNCKTKFCSQMMTLWKHMKKCRDKNCRTSHCLSSRCVLNHYRICKSQGRTATCEVCGPVMEQIKRQDQEGAMDSSDPLAAKPDSDIGNQAMPQLQQQMSSFGQMGNGNSQNNVQAMQQQAMQQLYQQQQQALQQNQQGPLHAMQNQNQNNLNSMQGMGGMQGNQIQNNSLQQSQPSGNQDPQQMQQLQIAQQKFQQQQQVLRQLQKQQAQLLEQQKQLQDQQAMLTDPGTQQAQQLQQQHALLQQLQRRCQQQQALIQQELMLQKKVLEQGGQDITGMNPQMNQLNNQMGNGSQNSQQLGNNSQNSHHSHHSQQNVNVMSSNVNAIGQNQMQDNSMQNSMAVVGSGGLDPLDGDKSNDLLGSTQNNTQDQLQKQLEADPTSDGPDLLQLQDLGSQEADNPLDEDLGRSDPTNQDDASKDEDKSEDADPSSEVPKSSEQTLSDGSERSSSSKPKSSKTAPTPVRATGARRGGKGKRLRDIADDLGGAGASIIATDTSILSKKRTADQMDGNDKDNQANKSQKTGDSDTKDGEDKKDGDEDNSSSLTGSMPKGDVEQHLLLLHKGLHLTSRTITHKCLPIVQQLIDDPFGWVFRDAVDPVVFGLPDYFEVVKNPMHLLLVKKKLENAVYTDMASFERDVKLVFENAILYNGEESEVGQLAQTMMGVFEREYKKVCEGM